MGKGDEDTWQELLDFIVDSKGFQGLCDHAKVRGSEIGGTQPTRNGISSGNGN